MIPRPTLPPSTSPDPVVVAPGKWDASNDFFLRRSYGVFSQEELCDLFKVSRAELDRRCIKMGLTKSSDTKPKPQTETSLAGRLRDTKGSYSALAEIAAEEGWTQTQVVQRYHRACAGELV